MIKLTKMNFYRMIHSRYTYVILMSIVAMITFANIVTKFDGTRDEDTKVSQEANEQDADVGVTVNSVDDNTDPVIMDYVIFDIKKGLLLIFTTIFVTIFVHAEEGSEFIKNIARQSKHKRSCVLAKLPAVVLYTAAVIILYVGMTILIAKILNPSYPIGMKPDLVGYLGTQILLATAFSALISSLTVIVRNKVLGIVVGMLLAMGFGSLITNALGLITDHVIDFDKYTIIGNINRLPFDIVNEDYIRAIIVAVVWFVIWTVLSVIVVEKRDTI